MHLLATTQVDFDEAAQACDLDQTPAPWVMLSFSDSDLSMISRAYPLVEGLPALRLASLAKLRHPYSVDLYLEKVIAQAKLVVVRLLGGKDYWSYGVEQIAALARQNAIQLAILSGDHHYNPHFEAVSTLSAEQLHHLFGYFQLGGIAAMRAMLDYLVRGMEREDSIRSSIDLAVSQNAFGYLPEARRDGDQGQALIVYYRANHLAEDEAPILALVDALCKRNIGVQAVFVSSLKDKAVWPSLRMAMAEKQVDIVINATAFSAQTETAGTILDEADVPVLQVALANCEEETWQKSNRGLNATDLAMHVILPEIDGRIFAGAISFKRQEVRNRTLQYARTLHEANGQLIDQVADFSCSWIRLRRKSNREKNIALILTDYPGKAGREGYAVGLDSPASVEVILDRLKLENYDIGAIPPKGQIMAAVQRSNKALYLSLEEYRNYFAALPKNFQDQVMTQWGSVEHRLSLKESGFYFRGFATGKVLTLLQPHRVDETYDLRQNYHDGKLPPCHGFIAFYLWLRLSFKADALIQCGTHGSLEWLPGKAFALSPWCAPQVLRAGLPVLYPFIVNNPGEAAQAKRRLGAVTIGHLSPALMAAGSNADLGEIDKLMEEYAQAHMLDPARARLLKDTILKEAQARGLFEESDIRAGDSDALTALDAWLCDIKEMRLGQGLHIFGDKTAQSEPHLAYSAQSEIDQLVAGLAGRFVPPGPAGSLDRGVADILPTGRNLYCVDPRSIPTRTGAALGQSLAQKLVERYVEDHGKWPKHIFLDLWASTTMRSGGEDFAQALALLGVAPRFDHQSDRIRGFEIIPLARLGRPRVDVTLRISGLFRDVFVDQMTLFQQAIEALSQSDESVEQNPLAGQKAPMRLFGVEPGTYGSTLSQIALNNEGVSQIELGKYYLQANQYAYQKDGSAIPAKNALSARIDQAEVYVHMVDLPGQDVLNGSAFAESTGGFAAALAARQRKIPIYHADRTDAVKITLRSLEQEVARTIRARALNKHWIALQMRHGYAGAAEIAQTIDHLLALAVLADCVSDRQFDQMFQAYLENETVRDFLTQENPAAAQVIVQRFDLARRRGLWHCQRNFSASLMADLLAESSLWQ